MRRQLSISLILLALSLPRPTLANATEPGSPSDAPLPPDGPGPETQPAADQPTPPRKARTLAFPGATFNSDDGLGVGFILSSQRAATESSALPYHWDIAGIMLAYFKPRPNAWGINWRFSWHPRESSTRRIDFIVHSVGWRNSWYSSPGNGSPTDRSQPLVEDDEDVASKDVVSDPWHRFGLYDVTLGLRVSERRLRYLEPAFGLRLDYDHIDVGADTLLAGDIEASKVHAPTSALSVTAEASVELRTDRPELDPTEGGRLRGAAYLTAGTAGNHGKALLDLRGFLGIGPSAPVVLAGNVIAQVQWGEIPFYELSVLGDPAPKPRLISGARALRGAQRGRYRGPLNILMLSEVRFRLPTFKIKKLKVATQLVLAADAARVDLYDSIGEGPPLHPGLGGGLRLILNDQLVVHVDLATGPEHVLTPEGSDEAWALRGYASIDHIF